MIIAVAAVFIVIIGCFVFACKKNTNRELVGSCTAPENGDVELDAACKHHLELSNSDLPASLG